MCNSVCHWLMFWMAGLELCLCKQNLPPCIHSPSLEWLLQECKSYLEGLHARQQPEAPSKAKLPPMPRSTNSEAPIQKRAWLKQARLQHKMVFSFHICRTNAVVPLPPTSPPYQEFAQKLGISKNARAKMFKQESTDQASTYTCGTWQ